MCSHLRVRPSGYLDPRVAMQLTLIRLDLIPVGFLLWFVSPKPPRESALRNPETVGALTRFTALSACTGKVICIFFQ